jgi:hypothetical protein
MADVRDFGRALVSGSSGVVLALILIACAPSAATVQTPKDSANVDALKAEVLRLSARVNALENRSRQEQHSDRAGFKTQAPPAVPGTASSMREANPTDALRVEAELRLVYKALMRTIERLDVSAEEKEALKSHLRPVRSLDRDNPWSMAQY